MKSVTAAELAALGAWRALDVGDRVGMIGFNDSEVVEVHPQRSQQAAMLVLHTVVKMNHQLRLDAGIKPSARSFNDALLKAVHLVKHDTLVVIISDFFGADERTSKLVMQLAAHNDVLGLLVHDPVRLNPGGPSISVSDGDRQMQVDLADKTVREKIIEDYRAEQERLTGFLQKLSAPLFMISNEGDVVDQVRRLLGVPVRAS